VANVMSFWPEAQTDRQSELKNRWQVSW